MNAKLAAAESIIGYVFADRDILWEALQVAGSGVTVAGTRPVRNGNKRLALLGDRVREMVLCNEWYASGDVEGRYAAANRTLSSRESDARVCLQHGLQLCLNMNPHNSVWPSTNIMSALIEAVIGAVYLDCGRDLGPVALVMAKLGIVYGRPAAAAAGAGPLEVTAQL